MSTTSLFNPATTTFSSMSPLLELQMTWGMVTAGQEPWREVRTKTVNGASMCYHRATKRILVIVKLRDEQFDFTEWFDIDPNLVEQSLKGEVPFLDLFNVPGMSWSGGPCAYPDAAEASRALVRWCNGEA